ncbi:MAG TPA: NigD-like C-terminal domain-containing protein [Draconibacterium sp.]|nr:NigD-like C-terminal domain-containing protein [Draconibacterium sp.]
MKKIIFVLLVGFMFVFSGCLDDDGYSLGDVWVGFGVIESTDTYKIVMDDGEILYPVAFGGYVPWNENDYSGESHKVEAGDRLMLNFTILDDKLNDAGEITAYYVKVNSAKKVLTKSVLDLTEANKDSIGNDPVIVQETWIANGLLNFQLKYWGRNQTHFINLVKQPGELTADDQPFQLELRHNNNDDSEDIPYTAFVSFHLDSLKVAGLDSVRYTVTCTDYDGKPFEFNGVYKYGENN